jgi:hypothetical protein
MILESISFRYSIIGPNGISSFLKKIRRFLSINLEKMDLIPILSPFSET